ncbi:MAG: hypothetical protein M1817_004938 [Caeruleum heppii]|nr:MAG: hypothetical protein M1817_004938 [Caeruleum heppii]
MDQVVDTMLHELSHIVHDAHDAKFHELWQQLRDEHEQLARKGYTGEGFLSDGRKLGGRRIPMDEARRKARAAAEKRRVLSAGSGQRLGGSILRRGVDMRQVIANAAQRRLAVTQGCASGSQNSREIVDQATQNGFRTQAEEDDANERAIMQAYIELLHEDEKERWGDSYLQASAENPSGSAAVEPKNKKMKRKGAGLESLSSRTATSAKIQPTDSEIDISINGPQDSYPTAIPADSRSPAMIWACPRISLLRRLHVRTTANEHTCIVAYVVQAAVRLRRAASKEASGMGLP